MTGWTVDELLLNTIIATLPLPAPDPALVESMRRYGLFQPIDVRFEPDGSCSLVGGRQRLAGAHELRWARIRALVEPAEAATLPADLKAILLNTQRKDMSQIDMARHVRRLVREQGHSQAEIARALRCGRPAIFYMLRILDCSELEKAVE